MAPAWHELGSMFDSPIIADVDCTADDAAKICDEFEVKGYPTLKYFKDGEWEDYRGGRDLDSLKEFVEQNLQVKCSVEDGEGCSEKEVAYIEKMKAKSQEDIQKQLTRLQGMAGSSMKADLKKWMFQRLHILKSLSVVEEKEL